MAPTQRRFWLLDQALALPQAYTRVMVARLQGELDVEALKHALGDLVARHQPLRTRFITRGDEVVQVVDDEAQEEVPLTDLSSHPDPRAQAHAISHQLAQRPFDLSTLHPMRFDILRLGPREHWLLRCSHHIADDGWSQAVMWRELSELYEARLEKRPARLAPLVLQYLDHARELHAQAGAGDEDRRRRFWAETLKGLPALQLPTDRPAPGKRSGRGGTADFAFDAALTRATGRLARRLATTPFNVLMASLFVLLARCSGQHDFALGVPVSGRRRPELMALMGCFVNTVPVRLSLAGEPSFETLVQRLHAQVVAAYDHQDLPFDTIAQCAAPGAEGAREPLFRVLINKHFPEALELRLRGLETEVEVVHTGHAKFDLNFVACWVDSSIRVRAEYAADLFDHATIERMAGHWQTLLQAIVAQPARPISRLPVLSDGELRRILVEWNDTSTGSRPEGTLQQRFERQAERRPHALALVAADGRLSYGELNARANHLARRLCAMGVRRGDRVGLWMPRNCASVVAMLGILKSGAAYVPVDEAHPVARVQAVMAGAQVAALVSVAALAETLQTPEFAVLRMDSITGELDGAGAGNPGIDVGPTDLAYIIHTSGSTGQPKGVMVEHQSVLSLFDAMQGDLSVGEGDRVAALFSLSFDPSVLEILGSLLRGATVVVASAELLRDGAELSRWIDEHAITRLAMTPTHWGLLLDSGWPGRPGLHMFTGGEALSPALAGRLCALPGKAWNLYGPTETTVWSTVWPLSRFTSTVSVGRPISGTQVYVLDPHDQPVPVGVPGELCIAGAGVARGYWARDSLTAERFADIDLPLVGARRVYRTGDMARWQEDGSLQMLGRRDNQIKLRGHRIELGEIEAALSGLAAVRQAAVLLVAATAETDASLVAFVVLQPGQGLDVQALKVALGKRLPAIMVPGAFVAVESMPLTLSGKIDRIRLAARWLPGPVRAQAALEAPQASGVQASIERIWRDLLGVDEVHPGDDFFDIGGHSLVAAKAVSRIHAACGYRPSLREFFEHSTLAALAQRVERGLAASAVPRGAQEASQPAGSPPRRGPHALPRGNVRKTEKLA